MNNEKYKELVDFAVFLIGLMTGLGLALWTILFY